MSVPFRLYVISQRDRMEPDPAEAVVTLARAGLKAFQWREKDLSPAENHAAARSICGALAREGLAAPTAAGDRSRDDRFHLFINDRADLALSLDLDLHLAEASMPTEAVRRILHPGRLIGRSTHSLRSATEAEGAGADFITFGPVFATPSKAAYGPPQGLEALAAICRAISIPVFALGGIDEERAAACRAAGAHGVAVIGAVWNSGDPVAAIGRLEAAVSLGRRPD